jgi:muconate cycloisomerase
MRITGVETIVVNPPIRHAGRLGVGRFDHAESVIVRLSTDAGIEGVGEASLWAPFSDNAHAVKATIDRHLAPVLLGRSPFDAEAVAAALDRAHHGATSAKAALDMACLDAAGKALDRPVHTLLGGLVRDRVNLSYSIANQDVERDLEEIRWLLDQGFKVLKIKTGVLEERAEIERITAIRELVGADYDLRVDFNQGGRPETALRRCRRLEAFGPTFIEQPLPGWDLRGMAALAAALDTPVSADESVMSLQDGASVVQCRAADLISVKLMKLGGIVPAKKLAGLCEAAGVACYAGAMWESGIGVAAGLHFACSSPAVRYGSDFYTCGYLLADDLVREPPRVEDGDILVPRGPGLGVEVDWDAVDRYRADA